MTPAARAGSEPAGSARTTTGADGPSSAAEACPVDGSSGAIAVAAPSSVSEPVAADGADALAPGPVTASTRVTGATGTGLKAESAFPAAGRISGPAHTRVVLGGATAIRVASDAPARSARAGRGLATTAAVRASTARAVTDRTIRPRQTRGGAPSVVSSLIDVPPSAVAPGAPAGP